ncbi:MAG: creatininase family protein [Ardenticatenaceae bacterium]
MNPYRYDQLTYLEIRARTDAGWLVVAPTSCTEQQGPHLPTGFDTWFAEELMLAAAARAAEKHGVYALVLPALPFGPTPEHRGYGAGYIHVPTRLHDALVRAVLESLAEQGFQRIVVWRGCGGHDLRRTVEQFNEEHSGVAHAFLPAPPFHDIWCRVGDPSVPGGHADSFTTSITMHLHPELVRVDRIPQSRSKEPVWSEPNLDFSRYSSTGVIGDATHASAELGAALWEAAIAAGTQMLREVSEHGSCIE